MFNVLCFSCWSPKKVYLCLKWSTHCQGDKQDFCLSSEVPSSDPFSPTPSTNSRRRRHNHILKKEINPRVKSGFNLSFCSLLRLKSITFEKKGIVLVIPKSLSVGNVAVRCIFTNYDHFSEKSRLFYPRPKVVPDVAEPQPVVEITTDTVCATDSRTSQTRTYTIQ